MAIWLALLPLPLAAVWQVTQAVPMTLAWLNGAAAGDPGVGSNAVPGTVVAAIPGAAAAADGLPMAGRAGAPRRAGTVGVGVVCRAVGDRTTYLSRELWHPEPPQSWPAWWLGLGRVHRGVPAFVFQVMPYSWQLSHFMAVT